MAKRKRNPLLVDHQISNLDRRDLETKRDDYRYVREDILIDLQIVLEEARAPYRVGKGQRK